MDPHKIRGIYQISYDVSATTSGFVFTGNDRNTELIANDITGNWMIKDGYYGVNDAVHFLANNTIKIKKARLRTVGAEGLRGGIGYEYCANIMLSFYDDDSRSNMVYEPDQYIKIENYNDWEDTDISYTLKDAVSHGFQQVYMLVDQCMIEIDDYNIQTAYIGESFKLYLDLVVDTAGMVVNFQDIII